ncbi:hypothetical protein JW796_00010 [Candidatus Dojkabacteria bacterium]|nr:hypothetical protein [Candidatus Dojkabacteria bacterium]
MENLKIKLLEVKAPASPQSKSANFPTYRIKKKNYYVKFSIGRKNNIYAGKTIVSHYQKSVSTAQRKVLIHSEDITQ